MGISVEYEDQTEIFLPFRPKRNNIDNFDRDPLRETHIDIFFQISMEKSILDIHLVKRSGLRCCNGKNCTNNSHLCNQSKCLIIVYAIFLQISKSYKMHLISIQSPIWFKLYKNNPAASIQLNRGKALYNIRSRFCSRPSNSSCIAFFQESYCTAWEYDCGIDVEGRVTIKEVWEKHSRLEVLKVDRLTQRMIFKQTRWCRGIRKGLSCSQCEYTICDTEN